MKKLLLSIAAMTAITTLVQEQDFAGKRTTPDGTDYKFTVTGRGMDGKESSSIIYVTVGKGADAKPEFTQVVR